MTTMLERTRMILRGEVPPPPIAALLGFTLTAVGEGEATIELKVDERLANPMGTLHGGVLGDIADAAMGMAWASTLGEGGRTVGLVECDVLDAQDHLVARASSTCMTLRGAQAEGR